MGRARPRDTEARRSNRGRRGWGCGQCLTAPPILRTTSFKFSRRTSLVARQSIIRLPGRRRWLCPWTGKIPTCLKAIQPQPLSLCSGVGDLPLRKPLHPRARAPKQERPPQGEDQALQQRAPPPTPHAPVSATAVKTQHSQNGINIK